MRIALAGLYFSQKNYIFFILIYLSQYQHHKYLQIHFSRPKRASKLHFTRLSCKDNYIFLDINIFSHFSTNPTFPSNGLFFITNFPSLLVTKIRLLRLSFGKYIQPAATLAVEYTFSSIFDQSILSVDCAKIIQ